MKWIAFAYTLVVAIVFSGCSTTTHPPLPTVKSLDLERYSGQWREIARYENRFEIGCVSATANYALTSNGVSVINRCYDTNATMIAEAQGKAYAVENSSNSKLKVTFFWPFYGDYWVIMLADDYRYSVVGDPSRKYLWILGRTSTLSQSDKKAIIEYLPTIGFDPNKLSWTKPLP